MTSFFSRLASSINPSKKYKDPDVPKEPEKASDIANNPVSISRTLTRNPSFDHTHISRGYLDMDQYLQLTINKDKRYTIFFQENPDVIPLLKKYQDDDEFHQFNDDKIFFSEDKQINLDFISKNDPIHLVYKNEHYGITIYKDRFYVYDTHAKKKYIYDFTENKIKFIEDNIKRDKNFLNLIKRILSIIQKRRSLLKVFQDIPPLPSTIYTYRCYAKGMSIDDVNNQTKIGRFLSTSFSRYSVKKEICPGYKQSCENYTNKKDKLLICIIIPEGSKVIPFMNMHGYRRKEYEILLPPYGTLVDTHVCHPKYNIPIFVYFRDENEASVFKQQNVQHLISNELSNSKSVVSRGGTIKRKTNWLEKLYGNFYDYDSFYDSTLRKKDDKIDKPVAYGGKTKKKYKKHKSRKTKKKKAT